MSEQLSSSVLRRMLAQDQPAAADVPLTTARALRLSLARAAEKYIGLRLTVQNVSEEVLPLDQLIERLSDDHLLLQLHRDSIQVGIAALDTGLVSAIVEAQTMGKLSSQPPDPRPMTAVDASLADLYLTGILSEMAETVQGTKLDGWIKDVVQNGQYQDLRQIGLSLPQLKYRLLVMKIDLGVADRLGAFLFALPIGQVVETAKDEPEDKVPWGAAFPETVGEAKADLPVILHRYDLPVSKVQSLSVGDVLTLTDCRVDATRLEGPNGVLLGKGRLGQMGGHLALRLAVPDVALLQEFGSAHIGPAADAKPLTVPENLSVDTSDFDAIASPDGSQSADDFTMDDAALGAEEQPGDSSDASALTDPEADQL